MVNAAHQLCQQQTSSEPVSSKIHEQVHAEWLEASSDLLLSHSNMSRLVLSVELCSGKAQSAKDFQRVFKGFFAAVLTSD